MANAPADLFEPYRRVGFYGLGSVARATELCQEHHRKAAGVRGADQLLGISAVASSERDRNENGPL